MDGTLDTLSKRIFNEKTILVTGGTGSFGKAFIQHILENYSPKKIIIFSRDEMKQYYMKSEFNNPLLEFILGDVRDKNKLDFACRGVDYVIHTAAMKIVPTAERNPSEVIKTNILGAMNLIDAAINNNVKKVIAFSTDKACNPINLYGATKLCSDKLFIAANSHSLERGTIFSVVRYGNVIGSRGSIIPIFLKKKEEGVIPITDERMTRFWILLEQGIQFVIKCIKWMVGGEIFIPKIPSMKIIDLARTIAPDCKIEHIGIKPGEKLHETMVSPDDSRNTIEFEDCYIIKPQFNWWDDTNYLGGKPVPDGFSYASNTNPNFLSTQEMENLIKTFDKKKQRIKTIIVGAGLSGLSLASSLEQKKEKDYLLIESSSEVGGLCKSIRNEGFTFDFGPHMLHFKNEKIADSTKSLLNNELILKNRKAGIFLNGKIIPYPFQYNLYHLNEEIRLKCLKDAIIAADNFNKNKIPDNLDEWMKITLGEEITHLFMRPYNQKCYCTDTKELTLDFLGRHVPQPTIEEIKQGAFSDMSQINAGYYSQFYYPEKGGIDFLPKAISKEIDKIKLNEEIIKIDLINKEVFTNKSCYSFINLVSTIPLTKLITLIEDIPEEIKVASEKINFNKICAVLLGINRPKISEYNFLYFPQPDILFHRVSFPMNSSEKNTLPNMSSICAEYSYIGERKFSDNEIIERTINDLVKTGIINDKLEVIFKDLVEINPAYTIFDFNRKSNLKLIIEFLNKNNIYLLGPFGKCEHSSMEDSILGGKEMADKLASY